MVHECISRWCVYHPIWRITSNFSMSLCKYNTWDNQIAHKMSYFYAFVKIQLFVFEINGVMNRNVVMHIVDRCLEIVFLCTCLIIEILDLIFLMNHYASDNLFVQSMFAFSFVYIIRCLVVLKPNICIIFLSSIKNGS